MSNKPLTDFGYEQVTPEEKGRRVQAVFSNVAQKYDIMNDLMSMGIHRLWKQFTLDISQVKAGQRVCDIAGGTGDLSKGFAKLVTKSGEVCIADINADMLEIGRQRIIDGGFLSQVKYIQANAECLPFPDNYFHCVCISFGLRNVTHKEKALQSMARILKPGGQCLILEFSKPVLPGVGKIYDWYSFNILPQIGQWIVHDRDSYQYLAESIRMHPDQETLKNMMITAGFEDCKYHNLSGGIVALHRGYIYK